MGATARNARPPRYGPGRPSSLGPPSRGAARRLSALVPAAAAAGRRSRRRAQRRPPRPTRAHPGDRARPCPSRTRRPAARPRPSPQPPRRARRRPRRRTRPPRRAPPRATPAAAADCARAAGSSYGGAAPDALAPAPRASPPRRADGAVVARSGAIAGALEAVGPVSARPSAPAERAHPTVARPARPRTSAPRSPPDAAGRTRAVRGRLALAGGALLALSLSQPRPARHGRARRGDTCGRGPERCAAHARRRRSPRRLSRAPRPRTPHRPTVTYTLSGTAGDNGWFRSAGDRRLVGELQRPSGDRRARVASPRCASPRDTRGHDARRCTGRERATGRPAPRPG